VTAAPGGGRARDVRASTLAALALAILVVAAVAALFRDQELKRQAPLVNGHGGVTHLRPGGPPPRSAHFHLRLSVGGLVDVTVVGAASTRPVDVIAHHRRVREYRRFELVWDGRTGAGRPAPPGIYRVELHLVQSGSTLVVPGLRLVLEGAAR
jgi:hypothetical protein